MKTIKRKIIALLISIILTFAVFSLSWNKNFTAISILPQLNHYFFDATLRWFHKNLGKNSPVVIIDIDEKSITREGKWPWPRSRLATLLDQLHKAGAAVVTFDMLFSEESRNPATTLYDDAKTSENTPDAVLKYLDAKKTYFDNDAIFAKSLTDGDNVLSYFFHNETSGSKGSLGKSVLQIPPDSKLVIPQLKHFLGIIQTFLSSAKNAGFTTTTPDSDGVLRRTPLLLRYGNALYPSLSLEAVQSFLLQDNIELLTHILDGHEVLSGIKIGNTTIPTDATGNMVILYRGQGFSFPYISAYKILHGEFSPDQIAGKIVLIGSSTTGIGDTHSTPIQSTIYPGVEVHATVINAILNKDFIFVSVWVVGLERIIIVILGLALSFIFLYCSPLILILTIIGVELALIGTNIIAWIQWNFIWPYAILLYLLVVLLGIFHLCYAYLFEVRFRNKLRNLYGQYVSNKHLDAMLDNPKLYSQGGITKNMSVLFADVRGFTSISEKLAADEVQKFLNDLFTPLTEIIFNLKGTIDKYVGDMIVAFWNDPVDDTEHAQNAVISAMNMINAVHDLAPKFAERGIPNVRIGVGINSGMMHVGDMGSQYRRSYTVLGDTVNQASRFESANKFYGTAILVSETTKTNCKDIEFRFIDKVKVKGKNEPVNIYEPLGFSKEITPEQKLGLDKHEQAIQKYLSRDFVAAKQLFEKLASQNKDCKICQIYLERVQEFLATPPPKNWDGAFERREK